MKTNLMVIATFVLLTLSIAWSIGSLFQVLLCIKEPVWFARSGAVIVLFSVWSTYITKPSIDKSSEVDLVDSYKRARDGKEQKENKSNWLEKYEVPNILYVFELLTIVVGTFIWAYGDTWLVNCVSNNS